MPAFKRGNRFFRFCTILQIICALLPIILAATSSSSACHVSSIQKAAKIATRLATKIFQFQNNVTALPGRHLRPCRRGMSEYSANYALSLRIYLGDLQRRASSARRPASSSAGIFCDGFRLTSLLPSCLPATPSARPRSPRTCRAPAMRPDHRQACRSRSKPQTSPCRRPSPLRISHH